ncbi:hypothetical protein PAXRUDRAFT_19954 [Paxillus rubicundulus Ve08.2h10]|uniref:Unplaced genomic scaffold scaffold_4110, whole genome shotgun sequence n=1 Tax=Paxillus rubicundulus Ve08.2h10 TaxID=930991 RepID=A0A0D0DAY9_9AGAM|nr:hypothetical protein PAXRUDRAFT_19954 [Paxillus rubicundulus Ve08.2h10]
MSAVPVNTTPVPPHRTREKNATQCPGLVLKFQVTRRTSAQKAAYDKNIADALAAKAANLAEGLNHITSIEDGMEASRAATVASTKLVRPHPKVIKKGVKGRGMEVSSVPQATSARYTGPPPTPDIPDNCTGGYGDNEQLEDDSHERAAVILASLAKGKRLPSTQSMSIVEVTATEVTKDSAVPSLKRKEPEIEYVSSSEQEDNVNIGVQEDLGRQEDDNETYEPEEEVEEASQLPPWFHMAGYLHKMNVVRHPHFKFSLHCDRNICH